MDITKINFSEAKYGVSFQELDVNNDGVLNKTDLDLVSDTNLKNQIQSVLNDVDDEPVLEKTGKKHNSTSTYNAINEITVNNFDESITNSKGTVYLVMGNPPQCGRCVGLDEEIRSRLTEIQAKAQVFSLNSTNNNDKFWEIYKKFSNSKSAGLPVVIKFVDGQPVEMVSEGSSNYSWVVNKMIEKAEGTTTTAAETPATTTSTATTATTTTTAAADTTQTTDTTNKAKTADDIQTAANDLLAKYPPSGTLAAGADPYSMDNPELVALKTALDAGAIDTLSQQGFTKANIIDIISKAYPSVGIKATEQGGYTCPYGHGDAARALYNDFIDKLNNASDTRALEAQVAELNTKISANNSKLAFLKGSIETLQDELEAAIADAIKESEEIAEEQKEDAANIVNEELERYAAAEGDITYEDFQGTLATRLNGLQTDGNTKLSSVVLKLVSAETKMATLSGYINSFGELVEANKTLSDEVAALQTEISSTKASESSGDAERCDPIGFVSNGVQYDFFVDNDKNGKLSNETEFLGAKNGWSDMSALDTNKDGKVSVDEMGDLMLVSKDASGNQTVKKASEVFKSTDSVDLNSYKAINKDFENGNTLLGSFSLTFNGQDVKNAYNTMDKLDYLDENYEFSDKDDGINRFAQANTSTFDISDYQAEYTAFKSKYESMETSLTNAWQNVGVKRDEIKTNLAATAIKAVAVDAKEIEELLKKKKTDETTQQSQETTEDDCADGSCEVTQ